MADIMIVHQGRVFATSPEDAAEKVKEKHGKEPRRVRRVFRELPWWEYTVLVKEGETGDFTE